MPVVITYTGATPTVDADFDVWGDELNDNALGPIKTDLDALAGAVNTNTTVAAGALPKAGGTATGDIVVADVAPTSQFSAGFRGIPVVSIDAIRTFGLTDSGKMIRLTGTTARVWTIPNVGTVGFPIGTTIILRNFSTQAISLVRGASVQLRLVGSSSDADRSLVSQGEASITMEDNNVWIARGVGIS